MEEKQTLKRDKDFFASLGSYESRIEKLCFDGKDTDLINRFIDGDQSLMKEICTKSKIKPDYKFNRILSKE